MLHSLSKGFCLVVVLGLLMVVGCGPSKEPLGHTTGSVSFSGQPVTNAIVMFQNNSAGVHMQANVDDNGKFEFSMAAGFGLPLGSYAVAIRPLDEKIEFAGPDPTLPGDAEPKRQDIPQRYRDVKTSGLSFEVTKGENFFNIELEK